MFKQTIEYVDFNGTPRKEDFYFHLSVPEVTRLQAEIGKPMDVYIQDLTASQDVKTMLEFLEKMVLSSYGIKTGDGKSFVKNKELREQFEHSQAYAELFEQLLINHDLTRRFAEGVVAKGNAQKNQVAPQVVPNGVAPIGNPIV